VKWIRTERESEKERKRREIRVVHYQVKYVTIKSLMLQVGGAGMHVSAGNLIGVMRK